MIYPYWSKWKTAYVCCQFDAENNKNKSQDVGEFAPGDQQKLDFRDL
jgi:hypothetical protein